MADFHDDGSHRSQIDYNDKYFRIVLSIIAAHIMVMYNDDESFFTAIFTESYLRGFVGSFLIAFLMTQYIYFITVRLDRKLDWQSATLLRLLWQTIVGFLIPALLALLLATGFFRIYNIDIFKTSYMQQDYALVLFMLLVINIYYFGLNSFLKLRITSILTNGETTVVRNGTKSEYKIDQTIVLSPQQTGNNVIKEVVVVDTPSKSVPVKVDSIMYCFILGGVVFIRTDNMTSISESHQVPGNLKAMEDSLDKRIFFRINRQMIVNFNACKYYKPTKNKTLELFLDPIPYPEGVIVPEEHRRLCVISEDRATAFKLWMDR